MKLIFIGGPYFGDGKRETIEANIREAEKYAIALANRGIFFFCPHLHTGHFGEKAKQGEDFYKALDFHILEKSDALLAMPRWRESSGARAEVQRSGERGIKIFFPLSPDEEDVFAAIERFAKS